MYSAFHRAVIEESLSTEYDLYKDPYDLAEHGEQRRRRTDKYRTDTHLQSAIVNSECLFAYHHRKSPRIFYDTLREMAQLLNSTMKVPAAVQDPNNHPGLHCILSSTIHYASRFHMSTSFSDEFRKILRVTCRTFLNAKGNYHSTNTHLHKIVVDECEKLMKKIPELMYHPSVRNYYVASRLMDKVIKDLANKGLKASTKFGPFDIVAIGETVFFNCKSHLHHDPWTVLVAARDILHGRLMVNLYACIVDIFNLREVSMSPLVTEFTYLADMLVADYGRKAYTVLKAFSSLVIGLIIMRLEEPHDATFYQETLNSLVAEIPDVAHHSFIQFIEKHITTIPKAKLFLELSGLSKIAGFPVIDVPATVDKLHKLGRHTKAINPVCVQQVLSMFRYLFCKGYYERHHEWPKLDHANSDIPASIEVCIAKDFWDDHAITPDMFATIKLAKNFDMTNDFDVMEVLSDKAISGGRKQWVFGVNRNAYELIYNSKLVYPPVMRKPTRLLIEFLQRPDLTLQSIFDTISHGDIPDEWKMIELTPKERELKVEARCFCKLPIEMRLWQAATESGLANHIFRYFRYQSMTMSEGELNNRLDAMARALGGETWPEYIVVVIDFASWNQQFRHENATAFMKEFDALFGLQNIFAYSQQFPIESYILYKDGFFPPEQDITTGMYFNGKTGWKGNEAFFEGMRQKPWTLITISFISRVAFIKQRNITILGQGDNQVIMIKVPDKNMPEMINKTPQQYANEFKEFLTKEADKFGIPIKPLESWMSCSLLEYSKRYYYRGVEVEGALKAMFRFGAMNTGEIETTIGTISTVASGGVAAAGKDRSPDPAYLLTIFETLRVLSESWKRFPRMTEPDLTALMLTPRVIGGLPVPRYIDLCIRGIADPLTESIQQWLYSWRDKELRLSIQKLAPKSGRIDPTLLIEDPVTLPLDTPRSLENIIRSVVRSNLNPETVGNPRIKRAINALDKTSQSNLCSDLLNLVPFNPRVMNVIYSLSTCHDGKQLVSRFTHTNSLREIVSFPYLTDIETMIEKSERIYEEYFCEKFRVVPAGYQNLGAMLVQDATVLCPTVLANLLRSRMWGQEMFGVTMPSLMHQSIFYPIDEVPVKFRDRTIQFCVPTKKVDLHDTRGDFTPYTGSLTHMRLKQGTIHVESPSHVASTIIKGLATVPWVASDVNDNLWNLVLTLIKEKTDTPVEVLQELVQPVYQGSVIHRLRDFATSGGSLSNDVSCFRTHALFSTDGASRFAKGAENYAIMFQSVFLYGLSLLSQLHLLNRTIAGEWGLVMKCDTCNYVVQDEKYYISEPIRYQPGGEIIEKVSFTTTRERDVKYASPASETESLAYYLAREVKKRQYGEDPQFAHSYVHSVGKEYPTGYISITEFSKVSLSKLVSCLYQHIYKNDPMCSCKDPTMFQNVANTHTLRTPELDALARAIIISHRTKELRLMIKGEIMMQHGTALTRKGVKYLLLHAILQEGLRKGEKSYANINVVPYDCSWNHLLYQWRSALESQRQKGITDRVLSWIISEQKRLLKLQRNIGDYEKIETEIFHPVLPENLTDTESNALFQWQPKRAIRETLLFQRIKSIPEYITTSDIEELVSFRPIGHNLLPRPILLSLPLTGPTKPWDSLEIPEMLPPEIPKLVHLSRSLMSVSTACSKLYEILSYVEGIDFDAPGFGITLAEGSGSMCNLLLHMFPKLAIIYNDLLSGEARGDEFTCYTPPAVELDGCNMKNRLLHTDILTTGCRDLSENAAVSKILFMARSLLVEGVKCNIVTFDAEIANTVINYTTILKNLISIWMSVAHEQTIGIFKLFFCDLLVAKMVYKMTRLADTAFLIKPNTSERSSGEVYLVLRGAKHSDIPEDDDFVPEDFLSALSLYFEERLKLRFMNTQAYISKLIRHWKKTNEFMSCPCFVSYSKDVATLSLDRGAKFTVTFLYEASEKIVRNLIHHTYEQAMLELSHSFNKMIRSKRRKVFMMTWLDHYTVLHLCMKWLTQSWEERFRYYVQHQNSDLPVSTAKFTRHQRWLLSFDQMASGEGLMVVTSRSYADLLPYTWKIFMRLLPSRSHDHIPGPKTVKGKIPLMRP